jgi:formylglycine-generating enzyme required for sulfatase activity
MTKTILICVTIFSALSGFVSVTDPKPKLPKGFLYIPAGNITDSETGKLSRLSGYYMFQYEITNQLYRDFLNEVSQSLPKDELDKIKVDSAGWKILPYYGEQLKPDYFINSAYNNYPVVNVTHEGASKYCDWLQQKIQKDNPGFIITVKLPSRLEWTYAAMGGRNDAPYPWSGNYMRDKNGKFLCNFNFIDESALVRNKETGEPEIIKFLANHKHDFSTVSVGTYYPNDFGLSNMSGNAAEMTNSIGVCMGGSWQDFGGDVKVTSKAKYDKPSSTVGFRPIIIVKGISKN